MKELKASLKQDVKSQDEDNGESFWGTTRTKLMDIDTQIRAHLIIRARALRNEGILVTRANAARENVRLG